MLPIRHKGGFFVFFLFGVVLHWHLFRISPENGLYRHVLSLGKPSYIAYLVVRLVIVRLYDYKSSRCTIINRAKKSVICAKKSVICIGT